ncbi:hypothetical protein V8E51_014493 [Hyaloscypha variabilis]
MPQLHKGAARGMDFTSQSYWTEPSAVQQCNNTSLSKTGGSRYRGAAFLIASGAEFPPSFMRLECPGLHPHPRTGSGWRPGRPIQYPSILRYPCTTGDAPVELHCDPEPSTPALASTVPGPPPQGLWANVLGCHFYAPRLESDGPVLIHNSPVSSSGINVSRLNTFTSPGHTSLCEVQHTLRSFATLTLAFTSRTTTSSTFAIGWSGQ